MIPELGDEKYIDYHIQSLIQAAMDYSDCENPDWYVPEEHKLKLKQALSDAETSLKEAIQKHFMYWA